MSKKSIVTNKNFDTPIPGCVARITQEGIALYGEGAIKMGEVLSVSDKQPDGYCEITIDDFFRAAKYNSKYFTYSLL